MSKSTRKFLTGEKTVRVKNFHQLSADLGVISFEEDKQRYDDTFNIPNASDMQTLNTVQSGRVVDAVIVPDSAQDSDGHPEVKSVSVVQEQQQ